MEKLTENCIRGSYVHNKNNDFGSTKVFSVLGENKNLLFWNSNNNKGFDKEEVLREIAILLLNGEIDGTILEPYQMVDIMWEVK